MASKTGRTGIDISIYLFVLVVHFQFIAVLVAINTTKDRVIVAAGMTFTACVPRFFVLSTINRKIHIVVIKFGRAPGIFRVALGTICQKLGSNVVWIRRVVIIGQVTSNAGIGRV